MVASDSYSKLNEQLLVLELMLAQNDELSGDQLFRRVVIEMNVEEARAFVGKLRDVEREVLMAS